MSSFQDLYEHAAADRGRAMQFLAIKEIRQRAVKELTDANVYQEPGDDVQMTDEERSNRRAEAAYIFGLRSFVEVTRLPDLDSGEAYAAAVRDTSVRPYCIALGIQTKLEELRANGSERSGNPMFSVVVVNDLPDESTDGLREALEMLKVAYPAWRLVMEVRTEEARARAALASNIRRIIDRVKEGQTQENVQELATALVATPLVFPAQRPQNAPAAQPGEEQHLQFGKARSQDGKSYFLAFTDRSQLLKWRQFGSVELALKDYAPLILQSKDDGMIIDPYVGANMCITREMLQSLLQQYEMMNNMMQAFSDMQGVVDTQEDEKGGYTPKKPKVNEWWKKDE